MREAEKIWTFYKEIHGITHPHRKDFLLSSCAEFVKPFSAPAYTVSDINHLSSYIRFILLVSDAQTTIYCAVLYWPSLAKTVPSCGNRLFFAHYLWSIDGGVPRSHALAVRRLPRKKFLVTVSCPGSNLQKSEQTLFVKMRNPCCSQGEGHKLVLRGINTRQFCFGHWI